MLDDDPTPLALGSVAAVVALVLAGVLVLAVAQRPGRGAAPVPALADGADAGGVLAFAPGAAALPADAQVLLGPLADQAREGGARRVFIRAGHDGSAAGLALARQRAEAVHHALQANGVPRAMLVLLPPQRGAAPVEVALR